MKFPKTLNRVLDHSQKVNDRYYTEKTVNRNDVNKCFDERYIDIIDSSFKTGHESNIHFRIIYKLTEYGKLCLEFEEL